jgi:hypothetical protein
VAIAPVEDLACEHLDWDLDAVAGNAGLESFKGRAFVDHGELIGERMRA